MQNFFKLFNYQLKVEIRNAQTITITTALGFLIGIVVSFAISSSFFNPNIKLKLLPIILILGFIFISQVIIARILNADLEHSFIENLLFFKKHLLSFYFSKFTIIFLLTLLAMLIFCLTLGLFCNLATNDLFQLYLIIIPTILACSSLGAIISIIILNSKIGAFLLPLVMIPIILPTILITIELCNLKVIDQVNVFQSNLYFLQIMISMVYFLSSALLLKFMLSHDN